MLRKKVCYDLVRKCDALGRGEDDEAARALLGDASKAPRLRVENAYDKPLSARRVDPSERDDLVSMHVLSLGLARIARILRAHLRENSATLSRAPRYFRRQSFARRRHSEINDIDEMIAAATAAVAAGGASAGERVSES